MALKQISQRKWLKGLIATQDKWAQSPGSVPRISNLILQARGGLTTANGSLIISALNGTPTLGGPWTELFLFQPINVNRYYIGIKKDPLTHLGLISNLAAADGGAGGTLAAATYFYEVTSLDGAGGETTVSNEANFVNPGAHKVNLTWAAVTNATGYNVYRSTVTLGEVFLTTVTTNSFTDDGSITPGSKQPPLLNNTQQCLFYKIPATSYTAGNILATFPADLIQAIDGTPGGGGGGGGTGGGGGGGSGTTAGAPPGPAGGVVGNISPLPQIVQFNNQAVLALGNGFAPQLFTDPSTIAAITNTFTATYPPWITATVFNVGAIILPTAGNAGNFIFTCVQGGTTGAGQPTWPQTPNQIVNDNNIIWKNSGAANTAPAPRGAAHVIVYAGSLWIANTSPTTTADNFDGPTCLKMSDLNNPKSWNPLNTAFLGKDDGDSITGLATFTVAAQGISPTGSLIAFKNFKTYQIIGVFGSPNFSIQEAQTDLGCIAPRSIQFLPGFGIARLTHLGIAIFDGVNDRLISEEIRPYIFGGQSDVQSIDWNFAYFSKGAQAANPPMYTLACPIAINNLPISGFTFGSTVANLAKGTYFFRLTRFTLVAGAAVETDVTIEQSLFLVGSPGAGLFVQSVGGVIDPLAIKYRLYIGSFSNTYLQGYTEITPAQMSVGVQVGSGTLGSLNNGIGGLSRIFCYDLVLKAWTIIDLPFAISVLKQFRAPGTIPITVAGAFGDGTVRRLQASTDTTFDGTPVNWSVRSAEVFGKAADARIFYRRLTIRGTTTQANLTMNSTLDLDGGDQTITPMTVYLMGSTIGTFDFLAQVDIGFTNYNTHITISGSGPIEIDSFDWEAATLREGVPPLI